MLYQSPPQSLEKEQFALAELKNKLANITGDVTNEALMSTARLKSVTGEDSITADEKFKERVSFVNYSKQIFALNELPYIRDNSRGFWDRVVIFSYDTTFLPQNEYDKIPKEEKNGFQLADPLIKESLTNEDELSGVLNWSLEGLQRLVSQAEFTKTYSGEEARKSWLRKSNSFIAFTEDCLIEDYEGKIAKSELRRAYADYCRTHKLKSVSEKSIKRVLEENWGASEERGELKDGERERVWLGVVFVQGVQLVHPFHTYRENGNFTIDQKWADKLDKSDKSDTKSLMEYENNFEPLSKMFLPCCECNGITDENVMFELKPYCPICLERIRGSQAIKEVSNDQ